MNKRNDLEGKGRGQEDCSGTVRQKNANLIFRFIFNYLYHLLSPIDRQGERQAKKQTNKTSHNFYRHAQTRGSRMNIKYVSMKNRTQQPNKIQSSTGLPK